MNLSICSHEKYENRSFSVLAPLRDVSIALKYRDASVDSRAQIVNACLTSRWTLREHGTEFLINCTLENDKINFIKHPKHENYLSDIPTL